MGYCTGSLLQHNNSIARARYRRLPVFMRNCIVR
jgi:hypothetical protein